MHNFRYELRTAEEDLGYMLGLAPSGKPKVKQGEIYILDTKSDRVHAIINPEERWFYDHLHILFVGPIGGGDGVYADSDQEAWDIYADWCEEHAPGLVATFDEALKEQDGDEQAVEDFYFGPVGNHGLYFTEGEVGMYVVKDDKIPPIPPDLFPFVHTFDFYEDVLEMTTDHSLEYTLAKDAAWALFDKAGSYNEDWANHLHRYLQQKYADGWIEHKIELNGPEVVITLTLI